MSADKLSNRLSEAQRNLTDLQQRVHTTAVNAHRDVIHLLELALTALVEVVTKVHATYSEDGELDENAKKMLSQMRESFGKVETAATACHVDLKELHVETSTLESMTIVKLKDDIDFELSETDRNMKETAKKLQEIRNEIDRSQESLSSYQGLVRQTELRIQNPVVDNAVKTISSTIKWLGNQISGASTPGIGRLLEQYKQAQEGVETVRTKVLLLERQKGEIDQHSAILQAKYSQAELLQNQLKPLAPQAKLLAQRADQFKGALIHIKAKSTELRVRASSVETSASVTSKTSYTKADFAHGIFYIVEEATFNFIVKNKIEAIMVEMLRLWTVDGKNQMPQRLKNFYDEVRVKVEKLQQGSADDDWNKAVENTQK